MFYILQVAPSSSIQNLSHGDPSYLNKFKCFLGSSHPPGAIRFSIYYFELLCQIAIMRWRNEKILSDKVLVTSVAVATAKANASSFCLTLSFVVIVISVFYVQCHQNNVSCDCCHRQKYFSVHREDSRKITTKISHRASVAVLENCALVSIQ